MIAGRPPRPRTPVGIEARWRPRRGTWRFRVRWTDPITKKRPPAEFDTIEQAVAYHGQLNARRLRGDVAALSRGDVAVDEFVRLTYWPRRVRELELNTLRSYASVYNNHVAPWVGHIPLRLVQPGLVIDMRDYSVENGVGTPTVRAALSILQGICSLAVRVQEIQTNPCREVEKPPLDRKPTIHAPSPAEIEAIRAQLDTPRDRALVSVLGYEGLRPSEALGLQEHHRRETTLLVEQRNIGGRIVLGLKNSRRSPRKSRTPELYGLVADDIDAHLAAARRRGRRQLIFASADGQPWTQGEYRTWREEIFTPAAERAGVEIARPYDLRHGCASALLHAGKPLTEVAEFMGHTLVTLDRYYATVLADLRGRPSRSVEQQIAEARERITT